MQTTTEDTGSNELQSLVAPKGKEVTLSNGDKITVTELKIKELPLFTKLLKQVIPNDINIEAFSTEGLTKMAMDNTDNLIALVACSSRIKRTDLDELGLDDLVGLAAALVEVNVDFFLKRVLPAIGVSSTALMQKFAKLDGQTS